MKRQVCIVHGGNTYPNDSDFHRALHDLELDYDRLLYAPSWKNWLAEQLPDGEVLLPQMPNKQNARYDDWSALFDKIIPYLQPESALIGHSLGGIFLAKYLCEHPPRVKYRQLILVAAPYDDETAEPLASFKLDSASNLTSAADEIYLFQSKDDPVVPITELDKYRRDLPAAHVRRLSNRGHFNQSEFPELLNLLLVDPVADHQT